MITNKEYAAMNEEERLVVDILVSFMTMGSSSDTYEFLEKNPLSLNSGY